MPEFVLDLGDADASRAFYTLDAFTRGYIEAMFFTSSGYPENEDLEHASFAELAEDTCALIVAECTDFQEKAKTDLAEAYEATNGEYDDEKAGRDFWYTRAGHGVGFWDRGLGVIGDRLTVHARQWRTVDLYRGDDELLYLA